MINLTRALDRNADRNPDAAAVVYGDRSLTHADLLTRVDALAAGLRDLDIHDGQVVGILMTNRPQFLETAFAVNRIGAIFLPLNTRLAGPELEYILNHARAAAVVTEPAFADRAALLAARIAALRTISLGGAVPASVSYDSLIESNLGARVEPVDVEDSTVHRLMYTSGTTSRPKGVPITYGNFVWKTIGHLAEFGITENDRTAMVGPMYHVGSFDLPGIGTWWAGGGLVILPRFDVPELLTTIERDKPTNIWLAPAMVNAILQDPETGSHELSSIRFIIGGGEKMPVTLIERLLAAFPNARFADAYGLTETVSGDTFLDQAHTISKIGSVGKPVLNLRVRIVDEGDDEVASGEAGEILLNGPKVVTEYWNDPAATAAAFTADGWFRTGDVGHLDEDGYLFIDDRKKDMIVSGGENIASSEVERAIYEHPAVLEAAVIAVPDERWGEVPCAYVVLRPGHDVSETEIIEHCRARIARFKSPKRVQFLESLPRTASGKVLKRELRAMQSR